MARNQPFNTNSIGLLILAGIIVGLIALKPVFSFAAWSEPTTTFPMYNSTNSLQTDYIPEVLNGTSATQLKYGTLQIGPIDSSTCDLSSSPGAIVTGCAKICLNPSGNGTVTMTTDPTNCVYSWAQLKALNQSHMPASGTYLSNNKSTLTDNGFIAVRSSGSTIPTPSSDAMSYYGLMMTFMTEAPNASWPALQSSAITSTDYAAQFAGTLAISSGLCLNDVTGGSGQYCIQRWSDIAAQQNPNIVRLQNLNTAQDHPADNGSVGTDGVLVAQALVGGVPPADAQIGMTCGDGICSIATETVTNCPADCHQ